MPVVHLKGRVSKRFYSPDKIWLKVPWSIPQEYEVLVESENTMNRIIDAGGGEILCHIGIRGAKNRAGRVVNKMVLLKFEEIGNKQPELFEQEGTRK